MRSSFGVPELVIALIIVAGLGIVLVPACRICAKAGYPHWLGVASIVPVVNLLLLLFMGFSTWPLERRVAAAGKSEQVGV